MPSWAKLTLIVRDERVHTPEEAGTVLEGDHVYFLAPPERASALDRFFAERPALAGPDADLVEDFFVPGDANIGALAEIYGLSIASEKASMTLSEYFAGEFIRPVRTGDVLRLGTIVLVAHTVTDNRVVTVGLQLADPEPVPRTVWDRIRIRGRRAFRRLWARLRPWG
jgi:cell volume regulation protein A